MFLIKSIGIITAYRTIVNVKLTIQCNNKTYIRHTYSYYRPPYLDESNFYYYDIENIIGLFIHF